MLTCTSGRLGSRGSGDIDNAGPLARRDSVFDNRYGKRGSRRHHEGVVGGAPEGDRDIDQERSSRVAGGLRAGMYVCMFYVMYYVFAY